MSHPSKPSAPAAARLGLVSAFALLSLIPVGARAQSLEDALVSAYTNNPQLLAERANLRAVDEGVPQALSNWRPTVSLNASSSYDRAFNKQNCDAVGTTPCLANAPPQTDAESLTSQQYGLTVTQALYRGGRTEAQTEQALSTIRSERAHLLATEQSVLLSAVTDFMNVVRDQSTVDLNINNEQVLKRQLEAAQDRFRVGEVTRTDVAQAEAAYALAIANRQTAEGNLQVSRAGYERDVGVLPGKLVATKGMPALPTSRDEATSLAATANPNVISAQFTQQAAEDNIRLVRGQLLPTVSLQASLQRQKDVVDPGLQTDSGQVTVQLSMPLYEGGSVYSQSRQAQQTVAQRKGQVDDSRRAAVQSAAQDWEQLQSVRATIVSYLAQIRANEIALDGVQQEAAVGSRTVLDILNAEQTLFQSRVNLVQAQHDEVVAEFSLASAVGRLTAKNLGLPVKFYDPDQNFEAVRNKWAGFGSDQ